MRGGLRALGPDAGPLRPGWLRAIALTILAGFLFVYAWWPMFAAYPKTPEEDGRYVYQQFEIAKASVRAGELPLWNAFDCRGVPMWDHPESMTASPIVWLTAGMNTTITVILWNMIHTAAGFLGMWLLARHELKLTRAATFVASCLWAFGVAHTSQYAGEHETLITFLYAPLLLFLWRRAETSHAAAVWLGIALAWMVYNGATYPLPFSGLMLALETLTRVWPTARLKRVVIAAAIVGVVAFFLGAARMLPLVDQLTSHKRPLAGETDHLRGETLWLMFTLRTANWRGSFTGQQYVFGEYIAYVGWLGIALVAIGVVVSGFETFWMLALAAVLLMLMMGHFGRAAPWSFLHDHVFPFKSMRVPARFRLLLLMCMSAYVGLAIDRLPERIRRLGASKNLTQAARVALLGCAMLVCGDAIGLGQDILGYRFNGPPPTAYPPSPRFYYGGPGLARDFIDMARQNRAWLGCRSYEWVFRADAPLWEGDVPQARALGDGATIVSVSRTPNTFTVDVDVTQPTRIVLDSAYEPSWQSSVGAVVETETKMLALDLPPGHHVVHMRYWPRRLTLGFVLSALGLAGVIAFFVKRRGKGEPVIPA